MAKKPRTTVEHEPDAEASGTDGAPDGLTIVRLKVADLLADPANVRIHDERNLSAIKASLAKFGQQKPIVVDANNIVIAGNGTLDAAQALGWEMIDCVRTDLSGSMAVGYSIADNRTADLASYDDDALARTLQALRDEDFDLDAIGFLDAEVEELIASLDEKQEGDGNEDDVTETDESKLIFSFDQVIEAGFMWFRKNGFPYRDLPVWECMKEINKLSGMDSEKLSRTTVAYQVADTYHRHRFHAAAGGMRSPFDAFQDDDCLRKALRLSLEHNKDVETVLWIVNGTQACSNFRPGFACNLYREYCMSGDTVLDTSTGYGGRLVGFIASGITGRYIGIDPNMPTFEANNRMALDLGFSDRVELHNFPAEDVPHDIVEGRCDFAFTSPPYFCKEHYSEASTQSWVRYKTGEAWRDGFLVPMLRLQFAALKSGKFSLVNIADVKIKNRTYPLVRWTIDAALCAGFEHVRTEEFSLQTRMGDGNSEEVASEPVIVLRKPS